MQKRIQISVHHLMSNRIERGLEVIELDEYDQLKDVMAAAAAGKLAYLKLYSSGQDIYIPRDLLVESVITLKELNEDE